MTSRLRNKNLKVIAVVALTIPVLLSAILLNAGYIKTSTAVWVIALLLPLISLISASTAGGGRGSEELAEVKRRLLELELKASAWNAPRLSNKRTDFGTIISELLTRKIDNLKIIPDIELQDEGEFKVLNRKVHGKVQLRIKPEEEGRQPEPVKEELY